MLKLSDSPEQDILAFVKHWMKLLAEDRLDEACRLLDEPNDYGMVWTPDMIRELVADTFSPDTIFYKFHPEGPIFTDPYELEEQSDREVYRSEDGTTYYFDYDIPLNHEWSDLTAQFEFRKRSNGLAAVLHDLHVM